MRWFTRILIVGCLAVAGCGNDAGPGGDEPGGGDGKPLPPVGKEPVSALIKTSMGDITVELWPAEAPRTVEIFLGLAEGTTEFTDQRTGKKEKRPFYDGLIFHRVIKNFMLQGGCPLGTGTGGIGYFYPDEINGKALGLDKIKAFESTKPLRPHKWLAVSLQNPRSQQKLRSGVLRELGIKPAEMKARQDEFVQALGRLTLLDAYKHMGYQFDEKLQSRPPKRGTLALANSGPNTNGSQFFIVQKDADYLSGKHTVFGRVTEGMDVVDKIANVPVDRRSRPRTPVKIESIRRVP